MIGEIGAAKALLTPIIPRRKARFSGFVISAIRAFSAKINTPSPPKFENKTDE